MAFRGPATLPGEEPLSSSKTTLTAACLLGFALAAAAAPVQQTDAPPPQHGSGEWMGPPPMEGHRPPMERAFHMGPRGRWWNNPDTVKKLSLTADQQKRIEAVAEQSRPGLTTRLDSLRNEEKEMMPLLAVDTPDESKILAQIDRVAQARAELEKANAPHAAGPAPGAYPRAMEDPAGGRPKG